MYSKITRNETKKETVVLYEQLQEGREEEGEQIAVAFSLVIKLDGSVRKTYSHSLQVKTDLHILAAWCKCFARCNHI